MPCRVVLLFLLFAYVANVATLKTNFKFSGAFTCDKEYMGYHITLWEKDTLSGDDPMSYMSPVYSRSPHYYKAIGEQTGDEPQSELYDVYMIIVHSCTHPDMPHRKLRVNLGNFAIMDKTYYKVFNITLTDQGEITTDVIGFAENQNFDPRLNI